MVIMCSSVCLLQQHTSQWWCRRGVRGDAGWKTHVLRLVLVSQAMGVCMYVCTGPAGPIGPYTNVCVLIHMHAGRLLDALQHRGSSLARVLEAVLAVHVRVVCLATVAH